MYGGVTVMRFSLLVGKSSSRSSSNALHVFMLLIMIICICYRKLNSPLIRHLLGSISHKASSASPNNHPDIVFAVCGSLFGAADAREEIFKSLPHLFGQDDWIRQADVYHDDDDDSEDMI
jgi:hypothetical protein